MTFVPGKTIKIKWPENDHDTLYPVLANPNDCYRSWLEKHVGIQCIDWDWCLRDNDFENNTISLKLRIGKTKHIDFILLKWG